MLMGVGRQIQPAGRSLLRANVVGAVEVAVAAVCLGGAAVFGQRDALREAWEQRRKVWEFSKPAVCTPASLLRALGGSGNGGGGLEVASIRL